MVRSLLYFKEFKLLFGGGIAILIPGIQEHHKIRNFHGGSTSSGLPFHGFHFENFEEHKHK